MIRTARSMSLAMALCATMPGAMTSARAGSVPDSVSGRIQDGYGRLSFQTQAKISAATTGGVLTISFSAKTAIDPASVVAAMPRVITSGRTDPDGRTLRFTLVQPVKLHVSQVGERAVVDLAPPDFTGTMPDLAPPSDPKPRPLDMASLPQVRLRAGSYSNFTRLVFDWPKNVDYHVFPGAGKMTIRFDAPARADLSALARVAPPWVKNAAWRLEGRTTVVEFETDSDSGFHDFKDGTHMVLDILAPKTEGAAYAPPGTAKPAVTAMKLSAAQAQAIAQAAGSDKPAPKTRADAKPAAPAPQTVQTAQTSTVQTSTTQSSAADARRTRDGARIVFRGLGQLPAAIFVRGLTAWIVVENAPAFEIKSLKAGLGDYAAGVEAATSNPGATGNPGDGLGILRVTLRAPARIAARAAGPDLEITIASAVEAPAPIGLARNQSDPRRASLSTLLPLADHAFPIADPASGDTLTVIPGQPGQGMPQARDFADFSILPSASGLVIRPYADDLSVGVANARVTIARPTGLALTPPQMPQSLSALPSAAARSGDGPSYLDFAHWGAGGSFLASQRRLLQAAAHEPPAAATEARLTLARFYLAGGFGAEALGLIRLAEARDPALAGDARLQTMRAAAEYMMGRYSDARNELASPAFDTDRHAALWRGLIEAGLEDWKDAHAHLEQAGPVMRRYPQHWQADAALADAEAALGLSRLDLADAALARLPRTLEPRQALHSQLLEARLLAGQGRYRDADARFLAVESGGDEQLAAQALYHHANAALAAGAITAPQAIARLEKLRYRWRGDRLELKTLRRLAGLYFGRGQWRDGIRTLRIATQNFPGEKETRIAQDDMRATFVGLYLKGGADRMKPVEALALFYDNLDLTPIGPDGDEMIRRMADRLVAVDLLGPAATLLAYQVDKRLDGIARAQVATRLAAVYLMDRKPDKAVAAIRASQITGLPDDVQHERLLLEARAFAALKQWDNALDLIAVDKSGDAERLRADIYWESGNWAVAGQKAEEMAAARADAAAPLSAAERAQVLRAAVAYSLANDEAGVARIRARFASLMQATPDASLFAVLSADIEAHGLAFREAAAKIAAVDTLDAFMKDFARRKVARS